MRVAPYVQAAYADVTPRTFQRELARLASLGFVELSGAGDALAVEIDFNAIGKH